MLGADVQAALPFFRAQAESMMVDRWIVERSVTGPLDETTGEYTNTVTTVYDGPGKLKGANIQVGEVDAAGQLLVVQSATLSFPVAGSELIVEGDMARCVSAVNDLSLVGVRVRVEGPHHQTFATARRFRVEERS